MLNFRRVLMSLVILTLVLGGMGATASPVQASGCSYYHTVRAGESLSWIARWYGANWPYLAQINNIPGPRYRIYPGQVLCIAFGTYTRRDTYYAPVTSSGAQWSFSISSVDHQDSVTIRTHNLPSNVLFNAKMGRRSGSGYEWKNLPDVDSDRGKTIEVTFSIPAEFKNTKQLVVRLIQKKKNGKVFNYDQWFSNVPGGGGTYGSGSSYYPSHYAPYGTIPTIWIVGVARNSSVTIQTANFPANLDFQVLMGPMGSRGYGYHVTTFNSGSGGAMRLTFAIPSQLYGSHQISIRTQNLWSGYYSYNWFYNNTTY